MRITLVLPELLWPEPEDKFALDKLACPGLEWLLAHGRFASAPPRPYEEAVAALFGLESSPPFGALRLLGEEEPPADLGVSAATWLCADPVHLRFHHERIILADAGAFELDDEEARELAVGLNRTFGDIGQFHVAHPRRWYVRLQADADYVAAPISAVAGRRIDGDLPDHPQSSRLRAWLNEVQMFLHTHPVNAARAEAGKPAVNSLWLWGAGPRPADLANPGHDSAWADDPVVRGLARASGIPIHAKPTDLAGLLGQCPAGSSPLVMLDQLIAPVLYENADAWKEAMRRLDEDWFAPLRRALGKKVDALVLIAPTVYGQLSWQIDAANRWKFWRRPQALADLARELAQ